ncbi:MAG: TolC family protein [Cytophagaceae bacterium]
MLHFVKTVFLSLVFGIIAPSLVEADTIEVTLETIEKNFLEKNLFLLSSKYDVDISKAKIIQAKLWENPNLFIDQNIYNQYTDKVFDVTKTGQTLIQVQQLFYLAGKRNKNVQLEKINSQLAEAQLYDILRTLKFELRTTYYDLFYKQQSLGMYNTQIQSLLKTVQIYRDQYKNGNIPLKEVVRLQAFLTSLEMERKNLLFTISEDLSTLYTLTNDTIRPYYKATFNEAIIRQFEPSTLIVDTLVSQAYLNRSDIKISEINIQRAQQNLSVEKAYAYPDIRVGATWDRASNYIQNYYGVQVGIDIPMFNRNQGNIKVAEYYLDKAKMEHTLSQNSVQNEVLNAYRQVLIVDDIFHLNNDTYKAQFETLINGIIVNYQKRNIELIEFIDFYESYKTNVIQLHQLNTERMNSIEFLNYSVGIDVITY